MGYFAHLMKLNELQINGETVDDNDDFNVGEDTGADANADAPEEVAADAAKDTEEDIKNTDDAAETQDAEAGADEEDDFTIADEDETNADATTTEEAPAENTEGGEEEAADNAAAPETTGGDDADDDFTVDGGGDAPAEGEGEDQPSGNDAPAKEKDLPEDPTDAVDDDDKRAAEEAIYDSLTDDQKRIRVLQLKIDYKDLYETIINTMEGINGIPKNADNLETIKRLTMFLSKAKTILIDYVENNFDSNSYLENYTMYIKYLAIFRTTAKVVEELNRAAGIESDKK